MENFLILGRQLSGQAVSLPLDALKKHVVVLGTSGSGKTVMGKVIIEESAMNNIPSIIIDPQGDLASLGMLGLKEDLLKHGITPEIAQRFSERVEVRIFTPASSRGIPLSINPLKLPSGDIPEEEAIRGIDVDSASLARFMGYDTDSDEGRSAHRFLYQILHTIWKKGENLGDLNALASIVEDPTTMGIYDSATIISERERTRLARKLRQLTIGANQLIFSLGAPMDVDLLMHSASGRTPVNIIYLNVLGSDEQKQFFVAMIAQEIYTWMLQHPSEKVQLIFYIDEIAPYMPPYPLKPPAKDAIVMLFKQGRKYGVSCIMATQNFADVDYKALGQAGTWLIGRFMAKQDLEKLKPTLKAVAPYAGDTLLRKLPALQPGEFVLISPDNLESAVGMKTRWLITRHKTLDDESLSDAMLPEVKEYFQRFERTEREIKPSYPRRLYPEAPKAEAQAAVELRKEEVKKEEAKPERIKPSELVYVCRLTCPQQEAYKIAKSKLSGTLFSKEEEITGVSFKYLPLWQVKCAFKKGVPLLTRRTEVENVYLNAINGMLCIVGKEIGFVNLVDKKITGIKDLDGVAFFEEANKNDVDFIKPKITQNKAKRIVHAIFGKEVVEANLVLLPLWSFNVKSKHTRKGRNIVIDGVLGREVEGSF